jgi:hypothetical protein
MTGSYHLARLREIEHALTLQGRERDALILVRDRLNRDIDQIRDEIEELQHERSHLQADVLDLERLEREQGS